LERLDLPEEVFLPIAIEPSIAHIAIEPSIAHIAIEPSIAHIHYVSPQAHSIQFIEHQHHEKM
jgi:hypothetical protein